MQGPGVGANAVVERVRSLLACTYCVGADEVETTGNTLLLRTLNLAHPTDEIAAPHAALLQHRVAAAATALRTLQPKTNGCGTTPA